MQQLILLSLYTKKEEKEKKISEKLMGFLKHRVFVFVCEFHSNY